MGLGGGLRKGRYFQRWLLGDQQCRAPRETVLGYKVRAQSLVLGLGQAIRPQRSCVILRGRAAAPGAAVRDTQHGE